MYRKKACPYFCFVLFVDCLFVFHTADSRSKAPPLIGNTVVISVDLGVILLSSCHCPPWVTAHCERRAPPVIGNTVMISVDLGVSLLSSCHCPPCGTAHCERRAPPVIGNT